MLDRTRLTSFLFPFSSSTFFSFSYVFRFFTPPLTPSLPSHPSSSLSFLPTSSPPTLLTSFPFLSSYLLSFSLPPFFFVPCNIGTELTSDTLLVGPGTGSQHSPQTQPLHSYQSLSLHGRHYGTVPRSHTNL